jgi:hypothetical protein
MAQAGEARGPRVAAAAAVALHTWQVEAVRWGCWAASKLAQHRVHTLPV